jgi:thiol-disulfide isomerase/thioredoxin
MLKQAKIGLFMATALLFILSKNVKSQEVRGVKFESQLTWEQIKEKAKSEHKYIFLDCYATWCAPCKWMDENIYASQKLGDFMNSNYISVKVQMDSTKNDSEQVKSWYNEAHQIKKSYSVSSLPTFLFFNPNGSIVHKAADLVQADSIFIKLASNALNPDKQYYTLLKSYHEGHLDYSKMPSLAKITQSLREYNLANEIAQNYINNKLLKLDEKELFTKDNLEFIQSFTPEVNTQAFKLFMQNIEKINSILGESRAQYVIKMSIAKAYNPKEKSEPNWDSIEKEVSKHFGDLGREVILGKRMMYYYVIKDWAKFGKYYVLYFKSALKRPDYNTNDVSFELFKYVKDVGILKYSADVVMKYAMERWYQNDVAALDTYANLLYKIGRIDQAIKHERIALKMGKDGAYEADIEEALKKMEKGLPTWIVPGG